MQVIVITKTNNHGIPVGTIALLVQLSHDKKSAYVKTEETELWADAWLYGDSYEILGDL